MLIPHDIVDRLRPIMQCVRARQTASNKELGDTYEVDALTWNVDSMPG
jgi:hypothetical protein